MIWLIIRERIKYKEKLSNNMISTLIIYSSTDGQTIKISEEIASVIKSNNSVKLASLDQIDIYDLNSYDQLIIGASIRYGKHKPELYNFIKENIAVLENKENAFFSVNVVARKPEKNNPETNPYMQKFLTLSQWKPNNLQVFAGKIDYPKYKFIDKYMIRFIMWLTNGPTNLSGVYEFTDWKKVEIFANQIVIKN
jgi:menaquinone-dependent protoporphyrinogen oxidase